MVSAVTAPALPLDVLAGYTVTREGPHFYTLTPTERTAPMRDAKDDLYGEMARAYNAGRRDRARGLATKFLNLFPHDETGKADAAREVLADEPTDPDDNYQSRAEWREQ